MGLKPATQLDGSSLVERHGHLRFLNGMLDSCRSGEGNAVLVEGAFGTGKSALLRAVRAYAVREGFTVLQARGSEPETGHVYGVVRQLFEPWLGSATAKERSAVFSGSAARAAPLFDYGEGGVPGGSQIGREQWVLRGLSQMLVNLSRRRPVLLLLDDLHWSDAPSLRLLRHVAGRLKSDPVVCCAAAVPVRRDEKGGDAATRVRLGSWPATRLPVGPLSEAGVHEYLNSTVGPTGRDAARVCHEATAGNPFFLREVVDELRRVHGADAFADPARIARIGPGNIARATYRWIQHAPRRHRASAHALARALAVLEAADNFSQLAGVAELTPAKAAHGARVLADIGLIEPGPPVRYAAPVLRNAVYDHLPQTVRYRAHYLAARILAEHEAPPKRVAKHLLHAPPSKDSRVTDILINAGRAALRDGGYAVAVALYRQALSGTVPDGKLPSLLAELGDAELRIGEPQASDRLRQAMRITTDPVAHAEIALRLSGVLSAAVRYKEAEAVLLAAYRAVNGRHDAMAMRLSEESRRMARILPAIRPVVEDNLAGIRAADPVPRSGDAEVVYRVLAQRAHEAMLNGQRAEQVIRLCREALAQRTPLSEADGGARAPWLIAFCLYCCGRYAEAGAVLDDAIQEAEALGDAPASEDLRALRAVVSYPRGMLTEAETDAAATLGDQGPEDALGFGRPFAVLTLVTLNVQRNQVDAAERVFQRHGRVPDTPRQALFLPLLIARGQLRMAQGTVDSGVRDLLLVRDLLAEWGAWCPTLSPVPLAVDGLATLGRFDEARQLATGHLAAARDFGSSPLIASALCAYARATGGAQSLDLLEDAVQILEGSDAALLRCHVLLQHGSALRGAGHAAQARRRLRAADEIADAVGATSLGRQARQELAALGGRVGTSPRTGVSALTPREHRVAALAIEGKRNQEIANILFVTVKTVEWHLSQVYRKLDITSRAELREAMARG